MHRERTKVLRCLYCHLLPFILTHKAPNTTIAEFANTVDPVETGHNEPSRVCHLVFDFQNNTVYIEFFLKFCRRNFVVSFFGALRVNSVFVGEAGKRMYVEW